MKLEEVKQYIQDITTLGPYSKGILSGVLDKISNNMYDLGVVDDISDIYVNQKKIVEKLFEDTEDIELYMNIIFDIEEVSEYLDSTLNEQCETRYASMKYMTDYVCLLTVTNIVITGVNIFMTMWY
jgi:hypothetical protein